MRRRMMLKNASGGGASNGLVNGDYTVNGGTIRVENNWISGINTVNYRNYSIPFKSAIRLHSGDVVEFSTKNVIQSNTNNIGLSLGFNDSFFSTGGAFCPFRAVPLSKTVTLTEDINAESLRLQSMSEMNSRSFELSITVNGEEVF